MRGPRGPLRYRPGVLSFDNGRSFAMVSHLLLLGGGSGVTPLVQLMRVMLAKPGDATTAHLVYFNHTRDAIMGEDVIRDIAARSGGRVRVSFVTTEPAAAADWDGVTGRLSADLLRSVVGAVRGRGVLRPRSSACAPIFPPNLTPTVSTAGVRSRLPVVRAAGLQQRRPRSHTGAGISRVPLPRAVARAAAVGLLPNVGASRPGWAIPPAPSSPSSSP